MAASARSRSSGETNYPQPNSGSWWMAASIPWLASTKPQSIASRRVRAGIRALGELVFRLASRASEEILIFATVGKLDHGLRRRPHAPIMKGDGFPEEGNRNCAIFICGTVYAE